MHTHESRIRVRYAETDQMGVVYYANYLVWMEVGRVEYCRSLGINYHELEIDAGVFLAVAEANCRYHYPARYDQEVVVKTWIAASHPRMVEFRYELRLADSGRVIATGYTKHIWTGRDMRPARLPEKYYETFRID
jgi:acyl-CoA thioester hydrolase